jgi:hypothetical protein
VAVETRKMNGSCDLDPIMGDFINFCKPFLNEG